MTGSLLLLAQAEPATEKLTSDGLTTEGLVIMVLSIGLVVTLSAFCLHRILREPAPSDHHHVPLDIDTRRR